MNELEFIKQNWFIIKHIPCSVIQEVLENVANEEQLNVIKLFHAYCRKSEKIHAWGEIRWGEISGR